MNKKALSLTSAIPLPGALDRMVVRLYTAQQQNRLWRVRTFATTALLSVIALVPVVAGLVKAFAASNFTIYISLIFTDGSVLSGYWKDIVASLLESLPVLSVALTLALLGALLWSLRAMVQFTSTPNRNFSNA